MLQGEHSAILSTFIKLPFFIKIHVLSIFELPLKTGFTVIAPVDCKSNFISAKEKKKQCSLIKACVPIRSDTVLTVKPILSSKYTQNWFKFQDRLSLNGGQKYCRMLPLVAFCNALDLH